MHCLEEEEKKMPVKLLLEGNTQVWREGGPKEHPEMTVGIGRKYRGMEGSKKQE